MDKGFNAWCDFYIAASNLSIFHGEICNDIANYTPGRAKIRTLRQVEVLWSEILAARDPGYYAHRITLLPNKKYRLEVTIREANRLANFIPIGPSREITSLFGFQKNLERYSDAVLQLKIEDLPTKRSKGFEQYLLSFKIIKYQGRFYLDREGNGKKITNLITRKENSDEGWGFLDDDGNYKDEVIIYGHFGDKSSEACATAGEVKKHILTLIAVKHPNLAAAEIIQYALTYGASRMLCDEEEGVSSEKDIAQASARLAQNAAQNTPFGYVDNFAVFMGKVTDFRGNEYRDGWGFVSNRLVSKLLTMLTGGKYDVLPEAVIGWLLQCRPFLCKLQAETVSQEYLDVFVSRLLTQVVYLYRDEITYEDQVEFNKGMKTKGKEGKFAGKVVVVCNSRRTAGNGIQFLTDVNGLKGAFDLRFRTTLNVLSTSHPTENIFDGASFSTQLAQSMMIADWKRTEDFVKDLFTKHCEDVKDGIIGREGHAVSIGEIEAENPQWNLLAADMVPALFRRFYLPLKRQIVNKAVTGLVGKAENLKAPVKGFHARCISDPAMDFGLNILKVIPEFDEAGNRNKDFGRIEVLAPFATFHDFLYGIALKFPKQHYQEFAPLKFISPDEYAARVAKEVEKGTISLENAQLLIDKAHRTSHGSIVLPAYEKIKNMLAGMDFDGDSVIVYLDEEIVSIMSLLQPLAVVIEEEKTEAVLGHTIDKNVGFKAMINSINNSNLDVGAVTNLHLIFNVLLTRVRHGTGPVKDIANVIFRKGA